jgi:hypothetical protein
LADGALRDAGEENFAQLGKQGGRKAQDAIQDQKQNRQGKPLLGDGKAVDHLLEYQRHADIRYLGPD